MGARTEPEKVARIYYWVQDHVRYIAFENGLRGFIPHDAGRVYASRYGDCKDMANLLHEMLRMAGVKSYRHLDRHPRPALSLRRAGHARRG